MVLVNVVAKRLLLPGKRDTIAGGRVRRAIDVEDPGGTAVGFLPRDGKGKSRDHVAHGVKARAEERRAPGWICVFIVS